MQTNFEGLIAATFTPMAADGSIQTQLIAPVVEGLIAQKVSGIFVCGSTGEGPLMSSPERRQVAEAYISAAAGRLPVIVQIGHDSLVEARELAQHAQASGADAISAIAPRYFGCDSVDTLIACLKEATQDTPDMPFFYYHIPSLSGVSFDMVEFLQEAPKHLPGFAGIKYSAPTLHEYQECLACAGDEYTILFGCDEMLLGALATGSRAAIGSTYNIAAPLYRRIIAAFTGNDLAEARRLQSLSVNMICTLNHFPFHAAMKAVLGIQGFNMGGCRLPQGRLSDVDVDTLRNRLDSIGFFEWSQSETPELAN